MAARSVVRAFKGLAFQITAPRPKSGSRASLQGTGLPPSTGSGCSVGETGCLAHGKTGIIACPGSGRADHQSPTSGRHRVSAGRDGGRELPRHRRNGAEDPRRAAQWWELVLTEGDTDAHRSRATALQHQLAAQCARTPGTGAKSGHREGPIWPSLRRGRGGSWPSSTPELQLELWYCSPGQATTNCRRCPGCSLALSSRGSVCGLPKSRSEVRGRDFCRISCDPAARGGATDDFVPQWRAGPTS
jgi:hypothetical protein